MKVGELIDKLKAMNQEAEIVTSSDNFEMNYATIKATHVAEYKGKRLKRKFRDAFDYEIYETEVFDLFNGDEPLVKIS